MCYICILTDRPDTVQRHRTWPHQPAVSDHVVVDTFKRTCVIFVSSQTDPTQYRDIVPGLTNLLSQIMCYICILTDRPDPVQRHRAWPHQPAVSDHVVVDTFKRTCVIFVSSQTDPTQYRDIVPGLTNLLSQIMS